MDMRASKSALAWVALLHRSKLHDLQVPQRLLLGGKHETTCTVRTRTRQRAPRNPPQRFGLAGDRLSHTKLVLVFDEACAHGAGGTADLPVGILQAKAGQ